MNAVATLETAMQLDFDSVGGEVTLDEVVTGAWLALAAHRAVSCPVCGEEMSPVYGAHALPYGGRCRSCGAELR